jgi:hypothetical protein
MSCSEKHASLVLSRAEFEAIMVFSRRAIRDGKADVDHIDIDAIHTDDSGRLGNFIFQFPIFADPVSSNVARQRLSL